MSSANLIWLYIVAKLVVRCVSISFLIWRRGIATTVSCIARGNTAITTGWRSNHVIVEIHPITGEFILKHVHKQTLR